MKKPKLPEQLWPLYADTPIGGRGYFCGNVYEVMEGADCDLCDLCRPGMASVNPECPPRKNGHPICDRLQHISGKGVYFKLLGPAINVNDRVILSPNQPPPKRRAI